MPQVAIFAGAGVKDRLDAKRIAGIIGAMRPLLRAGKLGEALEGGAVDIGIALAGGPEDKGSVWGFLAAILFFGLFFTVLISSCLCAAPCSTAHLPQVLHKKASVDALLQCSTAVPVHRSCLKAVTKAAGHVVSCELVMCAPCNAQELMHCM